MRRHRLNGVPWTLILLFRAPSAFSPSLWSLFVSAVLLSYLQAFFALVVISYLLLMNPLLQLKKKKKKKGISERNAVRPQVVYG